MRSFLTAFCCLCLIVSVAGAQSDRGTITGTIADPAGAMVPNAQIEAKNINTGAVYQAASSQTGNYTIAQMPAGPYQLSVTVPGFKQYVRTGLTVMVAQTLRIDVALEVGAPSDTVTVNADAPLLKTESGELSHNISTDRMNELPMLSAVGMRDPYAAVDLMPGVGREGGTLRVNGSPGYTMSLRIDGQDATQQIWTLAYNMSSPSVDSVEETAVQTSNYAAEYGQAGGGILNMTMRSGTNALHGSVFDYMRHENLNAMPPYQKPPAYKKAEDRQQDWGFNVGGPVYIPKVYDGRNKTFFFYSYERNSVTTNASATYTMPTAAFRNGDFSAVLGSAIGTDPLGRTIYEGTIYDPTTTQTVNVGGTNYVVRDPFMGCDGQHLNQICMATAGVDPVALNYEKFWPTTTNDLTNNYSVSWDRNNTWTNNAFKIDHNLSSKLKLTGYYAYYQINAEGFTDGLEVPISAGRVFTERTHTARVSADYTVSPTMLLHMGGGLMHFIFKDPQPNVNFDPLAELDLPGTFATIAPSMSLSSTTRGGFRDTGPVAYGSTWQIKPTGTVSLAWVKGNHSMKFGGELRVESHPVTVFTPANGKFIFDPIQTGMPYLGSTGNTGHPFASFLLGRFNKGEIGIQNRFHLGKHALAFYAQDSWKITPKITFDYGLRWDYQTSLQETYGRMPTWDPFAPNPDYGGIPGRTVYRKDVADVYPHAWGPRLGLAWQLMPKTVLRTGFGITYGQTGALEMWSLRFGSFIRYGGGQTYYEPIGLLKNGPNINGTAIVPQWPDPNQVSPAAAGSDVMPWISDQAGRPPRQVQWSFGIQREITPNLSVDISYVGNRGAWWNSNGAINDPNRVTPGTLAAHNIDLTNVSHRNLMLTPLSAVSPADIAAHNLSTPFPGFAGDVAQSLRPFPHAGNIFGLWYPIGRTWYDSMQVNVIKRSSYGLDFTASYSWQKELAIGAENADTAFVVLPAVNNINYFKSNKYISALSIPHRLVIGANYQVPRWDTNKALSWILRDWTIGAMLTYQSGRPIKAPKATSSVPRHDVGSLLKLCSGMSVFGGCNGAMFWADPASYATRVKGEPLFLVDPNSSFDPFATFMTNPNAWVTPPDGQYGAGAGHYNDYRYRRVPQENMSLGRVFQIREGMKFQIRVELMNVFNRVRIPNPEETGFGTGTNNITNTQVKDGNGKVISGFGYINAINAAGQRSGQIVMRFTF
ncbi:MAG: TonB-dependent receptor [Acidobacteria bacterium]|nr:TonB-dependent receptor [Acidobacteriota bacterium]